LGVPAPEKGDVPSYASRSQVQFEDCWAKTTEDGKPGIRVREHCLNVGCVAEALLKLLPTPLKHLLPDSAATLAALHDIGKVSPGFQAKCQAWIVEHGFTTEAAKEQWGFRESDHAKMSQFTVQELLCEPRLQLWAAAVGAHHGRIKGQQVQVAEPWEKQRRRLAAELIASFGDLPDRCPDEATLWFLAGLITVSDWIGSDERNFPQQAAWHAAERRKRAKVALATVGWKQVQLRPNMELNACFPEIPSLNSFQIIASETVREPGIYVFEAPMGSGKTEAALAATYQLIVSGQANGLYFALPTQISSNRIHFRVQAFLDRVSAGPPQVRLAHSASWLLETQSPAELTPAAADDAESSGHVRAGMSWFASAKRALLAPFGVGTIDQALLGVVAAKHFFVRQFGLAGKVVVLDEVHSYDLYTGTLIEKLVERLRELGCTVIILSATLTRERRRQLLKLDSTQQAGSGYPLISSRNGFFTERACNAPSSNSIRLNFAHAPPVEGAMERAARGECVLWIRNTVDDAQQTYRALQSARSEGGPRLALLHSRFPFFRREQLENEWLALLGKDPAQRPHGCILVSTQVAEQSVDIDADLLITDLAPTDMLLQRLGRLWRHTQRTRPCLEPEAWIQTPDLDEEDLRKVSSQELKRAFGGSARVYAPYVLLRSLVEWQRRESIALPDDIRALLEATYARPAEDEHAGWSELRKQLECEKDRLERLARGATLVWTIPALLDEEGIQTRYTRYPMARLLLLRDVEPLRDHLVRLELLGGGVATANDREWNFEAAKAIYRCLVPVPRRAMAVGLNAAPAWLKLHVPQAAAVGVVGKGGEVRGLGSDEETGLSYHQDQGVIISRELRSRVSGEDEDESYD
jgi:CRISPR-associated endonuclease/helicase Cas3